VTEKGGSPEGVGGTWRDEERHFRKSRGNLLLQGKEKREKRNQGGKSVNLAEIRKTLDRTNHFP